MKYAPMLCQKGDEGILDSNAYIFEPKLDGTRCIAEIGKEVKLYNRREKNISRRYPFICKELSKLDNVILDGEIVCYNKEGKPDFYLLQKREHVESDLVIEMRARLIPATYIIFDILEIDEKPLIKKP
ncbi:MAG TPA: DNA ligase, partial [Thermoplasmatales archaeon]|nr:DNA ligase [Thermoplasmatales archaeon]